MSEARRVAVAVVTHDSASDLPSCLEAVGCLEHRPLELILVDNDSRDGGAELARSLAPAGLSCRVEALPDNVGYAAAMNRALAASDAPWVLALNPDAVPAPDFVGRLFARLDATRGHRVAGLTGRLLRPGGPARLDACGMHLTLTWRHLDRGSDELDRGQWSRPERVFGATGAAALWRREALDDVAVDGEVLLEEFHSFREDAELAFRLRERGWEILYEPTARAVHRRSNLPRLRRVMPPAVNFHSLKNRYLLRAYHETPASLLATLPWTAARDLGALTYVMLSERSSLAAYRWLWANRRRILARRRAIQARRTVPPRQVSRWFWRRGEPL
jgi:GT2 family glycosyltransferase